MENEGSRKKPWENEGERRATQENTGKQREHEKSKKTKDRTSEIRLLPSGGRDRRLGSYILIDSTLGDDGFHFPNVETSRFSRFVGFINVACGLRNL